MRPLRRRQQADRVAAAALGDVRDHLAQEVDDGRLAEGPHLRRQLRRQRAAEALGADVAAAAPARGVVDADVRRHDPRRLVPEDRVRARLERGVRPLLAEARGTPGWLRHAAATRRPSSSTWHSSGMERDEAALGLAAERPAEPPRARPARSVPRRARPRRSPPSCRGSRRGRSRRTCAGRPCSRARRGRPCRGGRGGRCGRRSTSSPALTRTPRERPETGEGSDAGRSPRL